MASNFIKGLVLFLQAMILLFWPVWRIIRWLYLSATGMFLLFQFFAWMTGLETNAGWYFVIGVIFYCLAATAVMRLMKKETF